MNDKTGKSFFFLAAVILTAAFFRFFLLGSIPPSLFRDEAEKGYTAYSIMKTGGYCSLTHDLDFHYLPLFVETPGSMTSAIYQYASIPFILIFGLNEWGVRFPAAFFSLMTLPALFLFSRKVFTEDIALVSIFFLALSPWHLAFSRWALQGIMIPFLFLIAVYFFEKGRNGKTRYWIISSLFFALAFYGYVGFRIFILMFLIFMCIIFKGDIKRNIKGFIFAIIIFSAAAIPILYIMTTQTGAERMNRVAIFSMTDLSILEKAILFFKNYIIYYLPQFYIFIGDENPRHSFPNFGVMNLFEYPFFIIGIYHSIKHRSRWDMMLLWWLFTFPLAAAMTNESSPHALRSLCAIPMPQIFAAKGLLWIKDIFDKYFMKFENEKKQYAMRFLKNLRVIFILFVLMNIVFLGISIFIVHPIDSAYAWQYGIKQSINESKSRLSSKGNSGESRLYFSGNIPYIQYLVFFYEKTDPEILRKKKTGTLPYIFLYPDTDLRTLWDRLPANSALIANPFEVAWRSKEKINIYYPNYGNKNNDESNRIAAVSILYK